MSEETSGKQHLVFTDAEINAAASIINAMIAKYVRLDDDTVIEAYRRLLEETAEAKLRLKHEHYITLQGAEGLEYENCTALQGAEGFEL